MSYEDVCKYFGQIQICRMNDNYKYSFMKASHNTGDYCLMRLMVTGDGEHTVSVSQTDARCFSRNDDYDYSNCRMIVMKIMKDSDKLENLELKYIKGGCGYDRETHI